VANCCYFVRRCRGLQVIQSLLGDRHFRKHDTPWVVSPVILPSSHVSSTSIVPLAETMRRPRAGRRAELLYVATGITDKSMSLEIGSNEFAHCFCTNAVHGSVAEWLACCTQAQKGPGSIRSCNTVG